MHVQNFCIRISGFIHLCDDFGDVDHVSRLPEIEGHNDHVSRLPEIGGHNDHVSRLPEI